MCSVIVEPSRLQGYHPQSECSQEQGDTVVLHEDQNSSGVFQKGLRDEAAMACQKPQRGRHRSHSPQY